MTKKHVTAARKAQAVQELVEGKKSPAQLVAEYEISVHELDQWKIIATEGWPDVPGSTAGQVQPEQERARLGLAYYFQFYNYERSH
jgi:hypothetical protein